MRTWKSVIAAALVASCAPLVRGADPAPQPVLVLLHARFDDHVTMAVGHDRLFRLIQLIQKLRKEFPRQSVNVSCEFSGAFAEELARTPTGQDYVRQLKDLAAAGAVEFGYIGENEPTFRNRPKAVLKNDMAPEQRWTEQTTTAERALCDYRRPFTGERDPAKPGALRAVRDLFGDLSVLGEFAPELGGEAPYFHQLRRMGVQAVVPGFPDPYFTMNIHGYRGAATEVGAKSMAQPGASSELFWDTNFLRASFTDTADIRRFLADEGKDELAKAFAKLDRSRPRLLQIEVAGYQRYLDRWPDGTPKLHPLAWAYDHPDDPELPNGIKAFLTTAAIQKAWESEEEALRWLLDTFLPATPGNRVVSPRQLLKMARTPVGQTIPAGVVADAARDWLARTAKEVNMAASYAQAGEHYFSAADLFQMLANLLSGPEGRRPDRVRLTHIYGPFSLVEPDDYFPTAEIPVREIAATAAKLAPGLNDQTWRPVPANAVPARVEIAGKRVTPAQFLALMAEAYLAASPEAKVKLRYFQPMTAPGYMFPRQNSLIDGGHVWTLRPAPLDRSTASN